MSNYFQPWRRKFGVLTLVIACVMMAGWIKSYDADYLVSYRQTTFISVSGGLILEQPVQRTSIQDRDFLFLSRSLQKYPYLREGWERSAQGEKWCRQFAGFVVAEGDVSMGTTAGAVAIETNRFYRIPYWSLAIPLALLSAYLLLRKPLRRTQETKSEAAV